MTMLWTLSGRTKSAMYASSTRITGYAVTLSQERMCCAFMWKWNSPCETATAFRTSQVPAKRPSTSSTTSLTQTRPRPLALFGWRTLTWRWTPLLQIRASPNLSLDVWTQKSEVSGRCPKPASTWPFRTLALACRSYQLGSSTRNAPPPLPTLPFSQRRQRELRQRPWSLHQVLVSPMPWRCQCHWSFTAMGMASGWFL